MKSPKSWFAKLASSDNRKAQRQHRPELVAYYWDGDAPAPHIVKDVSATGVYLLTQERWLPGTVIRMTLQKTDVAEASPERYIAVQSKVIRLGEDGIGFVFVPMEPQNSHREESPRGTPVTKKALDRFLNQLKSIQGHAMLPQRFWKRPLSSQESISAMLGDLTMKRLGDESGQALMMAVLSMTCLIGFVALAADVGVMFREKRILQTAADSAAIAGALEINYSSSNITSAALTAAGQNGFTAASSGVTTANGTTITVYSPPNDGPHAGLTGYVEVIATQNQPTFFMRLFNIASMNVSARAVAENGGSSYSCVYVLNPTASAAMELQGSFDVTAPNCGVIVDSNSTDALQFTGAGGSLSAGSVGVVGGDGGQTGDSTPTPVTGIVPQSDPLGATVPPNPSNLTCSAASGGKLTGTLSAPAGGIACYSGNVYTSNVTLGAGTYVFTGNVTLDGNVSTPQPSTSNLGNGSTIDIDSGTLSINTGTVLSLYAPQSGTYNGIALMEPSYNSNQITIQKGDATGLVDGIIYAPDAKLFLQDSGGDNKGGLTLITILIVGELFDKTATLGIQSYSQSTGTSPLTKVTLVE